MATTSAASSPASSTAETSASPVVPIRLPPIELDLHNRRQLDLEDVVAEVLRVNRSLEVARETWLAASEAYPQVTSLNDPQFRFLNGPTLFGDRGGAFMWRLQFQQHLPWYGKRQLRGEMADSQAEAAAHDIADVRRKLVEEARAAFVDYSLCVQLSELVGQKRALVAEELVALQTAGDRADSGEQRVYEARLDDLALARRQEMLETGRRRAAATLNLLLHQPVDRPLPPPGDFNVPRLEGEPAALRHLAQTLRPDAKAARFNIQAEEAALALAYKEFYPDFDVVVRMDTNADQLWQPSDADLRPQVGLNLYVPVQHGRRQAAVRQVEARLRGAQAAYDQVTEAIDYEVQVAYDRVQEGFRLLEIQGRMVSEAEVKLEQTARRAEHDSPTRRQLPAARRQLLRYRMEECEALHECQRRLSELERALGSE